MKIETLKISGSIVLFKNEENILQDAIASFLNTDLNVLLYLIDNSPTDILRRICEDRRVIYIHNPSNPGFGAAHNIAIKMAAKDNADYHLVLNPDVYYNNGVLEELTQYMEDNRDIGNIMPKVLYPNDDTQHLCKLLPTPYDWIGRRFNPIKSMVAKRNDLFELRFTGYDKIMDVPYLSGCFMYLRMSAINKVGLFDERIFMYGEETDLCRRLIDGGYRTVFYPKVHIYHHFDKGSHKSWRLTKIGMQSALYYFNKWGWFFDKKRSLINKSILSKLKSS
ncbi:glycosyltransferase family 2 protein [Sphingobacterium sp. UDSM-2020]|uniref:glycosyltransferase family 2 protein n=1 Tax=Sphingobacterium sp. UDSM-2020 TaxID=2795738 RepID=UPI0019373760|nr:glycosyltransferase family 2 protein [Sphingobacterium sp. UDSM-2020]QQD15371.1 glycosyltransferase family 2 protein [Sphingobacterium sp. UDSM-2020]